jgi:hypothetical protein
MFAKKGVTSDEDMGHFKIMEAQQTEERVLE